MVAIWSALSIGINPYIEMFAGPYAVYVSGAIAILLVLSLAWLKPTQQLYGFAFATWWLLSSVYVGASPVEQWVFFAIALASIAGILVSPWFLVVTWFAHPLWDVFHGAFVPSAPTHVTALQCLIYDLPIAVYLLWRSARGFFNGAKPVVNDANGNEITPSGVFGYATVALAIWGVQLFIMEANMMNTELWIAPLVALGMALASMVLPKAIARLFWSVLLAWAGMIYAMSASPTELLAFLVVIVLVVLGYVYSPYIWALAWFGHAAWALIPRTGYWNMMMMFGTNQMDYWMLPSAAAAFEAVIGAWIVVATLRKKL